MLRGTVTFISDLLSYTPYIIPDLLLYAVPAVLYCCLLYYLYKNDAAVDTSLSACGRSEALLLYYLYHNNAAAGCWMIQRSTDPTSSTNPAGAPGVIAWYDLMTLLA